MSGQSYTPRQIALLRTQFAESGAGSIPGQWLVDSSVDWSKIIASTAYTALDTRYSTAAQGANGDTAFGWGDHAAAGYFSGQQYHDSLTAAGGELTMALTATPQGAVFVIYTPAAGSVPIVWRVTTDYTIAGSTITFVSVTPLLAGDKLDVQYIG